MAAMLRGAPPSAAPGAAAALHMLWPIAVVVVLLLALFHETALAMVTIWMRSDTFAHAFLVPPIALWLAWRRRAAVAAQVLRPAPWVLVPIAVVCVGWLLGEAAGVNAATQLALVSLIVLSVPAILGWAATRELMFPLAFLFFAVPIGEFLVDPMVERTADFTVAAIRLSGIPVFREGNQFVIPSGRWSVVEACSGVRYLIASFMVGTLFAYLNYRSLSRRLAFVAVSIAVPIVANWLRAYMIVMLGHLSGNKLAVGADHLIYGWVFFGVVILLMFWVGSRWSEPASDVRASAPDAVRAAPESAGWSGTWLTAGGVVALMLLTQAVMWRVESQPMRGAPVLALPQGLTGGWTLEPTSAIAWAPEFKNPSTSISGEYRLGDARVGVWLGYYRDQGFERKLITSVNLLVADKSNWIAVDRGRIQLPVSGDEVAIRSALLREPADLNAMPRTRLRVFHVNWVQGHLSSSDIEAKLRIALNRLLGRGDDAAALMFYAPLDDAGRNERALQKFVGRQLPQFTAILDEAARQRAPR